MKREMEKRNGNYFYIYTSLAASRKIRQMSATLYENVEIPLLQT